EGGQAPAGQVQADKTTPDPAWQERLELMSYDATQPLNVTTQPPVEGALVQEERFSFDSPNGGRAPGLLLRPKKEAKPGVVLFLHGLGGSKDDAVFVAPFLASRGWATLALDAADHGERKKEGEPFFSPTTGSGYRYVVQTVVDYRRAIDYIETRDDLDASRIGLLGASMGAIVGTMVAAVDERVDASLLVVGGGDWRRFVDTCQHPAVAEVRERLKDTEFAHQLELIDPVTYVAHISPRPTWFLNGRQDEIVPSACAEALQQAAREPKRVIWYDGGHLPPVPVALKTLSEWVNEVLNKLPAERAPAEPAAG
ncbi:MAG: alpha/beta fold hydrolase, partial [Armatimonadetes bacterium]|nr:alpha/beta fold hydrolase [Armatimonadota bacterium]